MNFNKYIIQTNFRKIKSFDSMFHEPKSTPKRQEQRVIKSVMTDSEGLKRPTTTVDILCTATPCTSRGVTQ